ncbi:DUF882 domain-containing protein [Rhizobium sp. CG5]|uniref:DUF882 domain-containing protein n=1 Tax=Rhizobium sp. CG5 TaxID=2726076 RepID=UPI00203415CE|nr:DUF882 domain-containing protein [Rhizobium sp. CG5]
MFGSASQAAAETRTLKIHFVHTGEKAAITFKRNGRYDANGLKQLNNIVRDWRRNQPTKMDPRLFDLVWEVYTRAGASGYINVVSGYRSPETNSMLRSRSKGVAKESQHMRGTAMDFYIPGVPLKTLRELGIKMQAGGVGYYPNSGSPFVHMDVAGVRAWPRMTRNELSRLFPDGKTVHIPSDGKPLPGYNQALAEYKQRLNSKQILMADSKEPSKRKNLLAMLFGGGDEDEEEDVVVPAERPAIAKPVVTAEQPILVAAAVPPPEPSPAEASVDPSIVAPVPLSRPAFRPQAGNESLAVALYSPNRSAAEDALQKVATPQPPEIAAAVDPEQASDEGFADLQTYKIPVPTLLGQRGMKGDAETYILTASVAPGSLPPVDDGAAGIPIPAGRPALADALAATAEVSPKSEPMSVEQAILSPEAASALEQSQMPVRQPAEPKDSALAAPVPTPMPAPAKPIATAVAAVPVAKPHPAETAKPRATEVASIAPAKPSTRTVDFGDVFDEPKPVDTSVEAGLPAKGGRPSLSEAEAAHRAMTGGTKLTGNMLSQWALNKERVGTVGKGGKAPRIVSRSLSAESAAVYPVGFSSQPAPIDPGRFGAAKP